MYTYHYVFTSYRVVVVFLYFLIRTRLAPLDQNHSGIGKDDGQVANLGVGLVLVFRSAVAPIALHASLDQLLFYSGVFCWSLVVMEIVEPLGGECTVISFRPCTLVW